MSTPITNTQLSLRIINALCRNGLFTVEDVIKYHNEYGIDTAKGVGKEAVDDINSAILLPAGFGIPLKKPRVKKEQTLSRPRKKAMRYNVSQLLRFKQYFDELYGQGLEVSNWHLNGELESFDNFYDSAIEFSLKKENTK